MQNQQLAQESDSLWKLPSSSARAEGEKTELRLQRASLSLPNFKIKATMATEGQTFFSSAERYLSLQRNTHSLKYKSNLCELDFLNALFEWVHLSSVLRTYSRVLPLCTINTSSFLAALWETTGSWQPWDLRVLFSAIILIFCCLYPCYLGVGSHCYFIEWTLAMSAWKVLLTSGKVNFL